MTGDQLGELREAVQAAANALAAVADKLDAASEPAPEPGPPSDAPAIKRVAMTFRTTEAAYERLRRRASETRVSQQAIVDQALDYFLGERTAA
jgi:cytochrome c556